MSLFLPLVVPAEGNIIHFTNSFSVFTIGEVFFLVCREHKESTDGFVVLLVFSKGFNYTFNGLGFLFFKNATLSIFSETDDCIYSISESGVVSRQKSCKHIEYLISP